MLKMAVAVAMPAVCLGLALAQSPPEQRRAYMATVSRLMGTGLADEAMTPSRSIQAAQPVVQPVAYGMSTVIDANRQGQYETTMEVAGRNLPVLVDTGATYVSLSFEDAASLGIHPVASDFKYRMRTANGEAKAAGAVIPLIRVGNVEARNVQAVVSEAGALTLHNLLGMSFLSKLSGFRVDSGRLVLNQ